MTDFNRTAETASDLGADAQHSAEELGRSATRKLDEARVGTAGALHTAANSIRDKGRKGSEAFGNLAAKTADRLDASGSYLENHDMQDAYSGLRGFSTRHLAGSLIAAAAIGFLAGSAFSRASGTSNRTR